MFLLLLSRSLLFNWWASMEFGDDFLIYVIFLGEHDF